MMSAKVPQRVQVFTDLDGTLLDHHSYRFDAALPALAELRARDIPVIIASSKTAAEIRPLQRQLTLDAPFICENGAAVHLPDGQGNWATEDFAPRHERVLAVLHDLRAQGFHFAGFSDWGVEGIAARTGLSHEQAALAAQREYSEPLLWQDTQERKADFQAALEEAGCRPSRAAAS